MAKKSKTKTVTEVTKIKIEEICINCSKAVNCGNDCRSYGRDAGWNFSRRRTGKCIGFIPSNIIQI